MLYHTYSTCKTFILMSLNTKKVNGLIRSLKPLSTIYSDITCCSLGYCVAVRHTRINYKGIYIMIRKIVYVPHVYTCNTVSVTGALFKTLWGKDKLFVI